MSGVVIENVTKKFGTFTAVDDLNAEFATDETTCLLGPSGCGKTTLMRMIAGLESPTKGRIFVGGQDVTHLPPRKRDVAMVFQYPVMYATLSVAENIALPLRRNRLISSRERDMRVDEVLSMLEMQEKANARIDELGAGERQKVAIGRSIARRTSIVLFDEPTTNVEAASKITLVRTLKTISTEQKQTIVYVTHDQTEAMTLSDKIALMKDGAIIQHDMPINIYLRPSTPFGGWFVGNPGMNFFELKRSGSKYCSAIFKEGIVRHTDDSVEILAGIRPEHINVRATAHKNSLEALVIDQAIGVGGQIVSTVSVDGTKFKIKYSSAVGCSAGDRIHISIPPQKLVFFQDDALVEEFGSSVENQRQPIDSSN